MKYDGDMMMNGQTDAILKTKRLRLRYQENTDLDFLIKLWTDPEITKYVGGPRTKESLEKNFNETAADPQKEEYDLRYVVLKETNELIGMAGIIPKDIEGQNFYEINYYIDKNHQNIGFAAEIAAGILSHHREKAGINTFIVIIDKNNIASIKVAEKIGFRFWKTVTRSSGPKDIYRID
ncbi:MAG: GNAT family N-acetyltransferase [Treponema sp.]|nr:GNAT family N-acetyltransferase [Treponema sp.]